MKVNGQMFTMVGIAPKEFTGTTLGSEPDIYVPLVFKPLLTPNWNGTDRWSDYWLYVIARPQRGLSRSAGGSRAQQRLRRPAGAAIARCRISTTRSNAIASCMRGSPSRRAATGKVVCAIRAGRR